MLFQCTSVLEPSAVLVSLLHREEVTRLRSLESSYVGSLGREVGGADWTQLRQFKHADARERDSYFDQLQVLLALGSYSLCCAEQFRLLGEGLEHSLFSVHISFSTV
jgi:hypothetical protein